MTIEIHQDRAIFEISGQDRKKFIQGLITNDINKVGDSHLIYSAMLNAKGRFASDLFIFESQEKLILDCPKDIIDSIIQKLSMYKLRADIQITKNTDLTVGYLDKKNANQPAFTFLDPRTPILGYRTYFTESDAISDQTNQTYDELRIRNKIPEGLKDLTPEKSLILEFNFDNLHAIDYEKGCYIGQELTTRTHYRGEIRKKIMHITLASHTPEMNSNVPKVKKNAEITCEGKVVGIILSSLCLGPEIHALALIKTLETASNQSFFLEDTQIIIVD